AHFSAALIVSRHCQRPRCFGYSRCHQLDSIQGRIAPCPPQPLCLSLSSATSRTGAAFSLPLPRMRFPYWSEQSTPSPPPQQTGCTCAQPICSARRVSASLLLLYSPSALAAPTRALSSTILWTSGSPQAPEAFTSAKTAFPFPMRAASAITTKKIPASSSTF